jgi:hypothetical protein
MSADGILNMTMAGLEAGFNVTHIAAFPPETCDAEADISEVLRAPDLSEFDHIPVKERGHIVGVLERNRSASAGMVRTHMEPLNDSMLVSAEEPLAKFLPTLTKTPYRLMVKDTQIEGIVTLSDVPKLPVRLVGFTLVTHLEMLMAELIRTRCPADESWLELLDPNRKRILRGLLQTRIAEHLHLSHLQVTDFRDKITVVVKLLELDESATGELRLIRDLRNSVAHSRDLAHGDAGVQAFLGYLHLAEKWTETLAVFARASK